MTATVVTIVGLTLVGGAVALVPLDVFLVSNTVDVSTGLKKDWADPSFIYWMALGVQLLYYVFYGFIVLLCFFLLPFTYAYYEEYEVQKRTSTAFKYSLFFAFWGVFFFFFALLIKPNRYPLPVELEWFMNLLDESNGAKAFWFVVGCLLIAGMAVFIVYTAPGLSLIPFKLIKGKNKSEIRHDEINQKLIHVREQQKLIEQKYAGSKKTPKTHDRTLLANYKDEERIILRLLAEVQEEEHTLFGRILRLIHPFRTFIGLLLLFWTWILMGCLFVTLIDKSLYSVCGSDCGYLIGHTELLSLTDYIFTGLQRAFPIDYGWLLLFIVYFFLATVMGITRLGVKFLWVTLYRIRRRATAPQGLLITTLLSTLGLLAFVYTFTSTLAPGYTHFGSQVYCNYLEGEERDCTGREEEIIPCDIYGPADICTPTTTSVLLDRISLNTPLFGWVYYYSQWAFLVTFVFGFLVALFKSPQEWVHQEDSEEQGLLDGHHSHHFYHRHHADNQ
ncbi:hypothetical protein BY458DRAFT_521705 [Sporodiniella umbellata]|nr:hypothetical protein BY458DRAFT_521705 [Sporodiniella umbellata]